MPLIATLMFALAVAPGALAGEHTVIIKDRELNPENVTAKVGDILVFRNEDEIVHSLYSMTPGHKFRFGEQPPGQIRKVQLDAPGEMTVRCHIHTIIRMGVVISE